MGPKDIVDADGDVTIQAGEPLPEPYGPTAAQRAARNTTHLPYASWCPHCVAARRANSHHRSQSGACERTVPLLVGDYCMLRDSNDNDLAQVLVCRLYPARALMATACDAKGADDHAITNLSALIKESCYRNIVYKSDQERSIRSMLEETFKRLGSQGVNYNPKLEQFIPEASAAGESQSNGRAESSVRRLEDLVCTYKSALETRLSTRIASTHPVFKWLVEHAASVHNRFVCGPDGRTPYEHSHGQPSRGKLAEFGEQVFYDVPKRVRAKMNLRFRVGTFLGNAQTSNECYVAIANGDVVKSRSMVRMLETSRWNAKAVLAVVGTPSNLTP